MKERALLSKTKCASKHTKLILILLTNSNSNSIIAINFG